MAEGGETLARLVRWAEPGSRAAGCERRAPLRSSPFKKKFRYLDGCVVAFERARRIETTA